MKQRQRRLGLGEHPVLCSYSPLYEWQLACRWRRPGLGSWMWLSRGHVLVRDPEGRFAVGTWQQDKVSLRGLMLPFGRLTDIACRSFSGVYGERHISHSYLRHSCRISKNPYHPPCTTVLPVSSDAKPDNYSSQPCLLPPRTPYTSQRHSRPTYHIRPCVFESLFARAMGWWAS